MQRLTYTLIFISLLIVSWAQNNDLWYFSNPPIAVDFSNGPPANIPYNGNGMFSTTECSAIIKDNTGNLLFYTQGDDLYDGNHNKTPNGSDIYGNPSSVQGALFVPLPGSVDTIYLFTTAMQAGFSPNQQIPNEHSGLCYTVIDKSLNGGSGDIIIGQKNITLVEPTSEQLTAVRHANGRDVWILAVEWQTANMYAYLLRPNGLCNPVITNIGTPQSGGNYNSAGGQLKANHEGNKVAHPMTYLGLLEIMDFDNSTGIFSNSMTFDFSGKSPYGVEFSPSDQYLYISAYGSIYQLDISLGNQAAINNSMTTISSTGASPSIYACMLQIGPDDKIYWPRYNGNYLGVIANPDMPGSLCNASSSGLNLSSGTKHGLPNFFKGSVFVLDTIGFEEESIGFSYSDLCADQLINFYDTSKGNDLIYSWIFSNGNAYDTSDLSLILSEGSYLINYNIANVCTSLSMDTSLMIEPCADNNFYLPTAFSPNSDGINDALMLRGNNISSIKIMIFDRLGNLVYDSEDPLFEWRALEISSQVVVYDLNITFNDGEIINKKGNITLTN